MTLVRSAGRAAAVLVVAAAGLVGPATAPAGADPGACTPTSGVVVAVDFRPFGGGIKRGCDPNPTTGLTALHVAGFPSVGTQHDGPGFVCRISGLPTAAVEPCVVTPPASRYWSYWHADAGQTTWSYSQLGAAGYAPKPGSVDAWVYGATDTGGTTGGPSFSVSSVRATTPVAAPVPPAPSSAPPASGGSSGGAPGGSSGGSAGSGSGGSGSGTGRSGGSASSPSGARTTGSAAAASGTSTSSPSDAGAAAPTTATDPATSAPTTDLPATDLPTAAATSSSATTDPTVTDVRAAPLAAEPASGSAWPLLAGVALLLALGTAAGVVALRRRGGGG